MQSDQELLALLLRHKSLPDRLLKNFGTVRNVLSATPQELTAQSGLGPKRAAVLKAVRELCLRFWDSQETPSPKVVSPADAYGVFKDLAYEKQEVVAAAFLTTRNHLISRQEIFRGTLTQTPGSPREILSLGLRSHAAKLIIAHNHPSGLVDPSPEDIRFTQLLWQASRVVGIYLVDHLIVAEAGLYYSFAESGLLKS